MPPPLPIGDNGGDEHVATVSKPGKRIQPTVTKPRMDGGATTRPGTLRRSRPELPAETRADPQQQNLGSSLPWRSLFRTSAPPSSAARAATMSPC
jgi:hypothetical protein